MRNLIAVLLAMANVIADIPGRPQADSGAPIVILCTHIDTKLFEFRFLGANDGGSGTAVLLELARGLAATAPHPVTYRLIFLDGEEALRDAGIHPEPSNAHRWGFSVGAGMMGVAFNELESVHAQRFRRRNVRRCCRILRIHWI